MPIHLSQTPMPVPASIEDDVHHKIYHNSPCHRTLHDARHHSGFRTPLLQTPHRPLTNDWPLSSAAKSTAPKLVPLISKFETLDAASMGYAVRDAQPPHLRLPRSRMDDRKNVNMQEIKSTRERLLSLFERPGWGAGTLRGFQGIEDANASAVFDHVSYGNERPLTRLERLEDDIPPHLRPMLKGTNTSEKWLGKTKEPGMRGRRESKIKEKIKFFDRSIERHLSHVREMWNRSRVDGAVSSNPPSKHPSVFSPSGLQLHPQSLAKKPIERKTPTKSYGNLVLKQKRPSPLKTSDWRDRAHRVQLCDREVIPTRIRMNERLCCPPIIQPYVKESTAMRNVQIVYEGPKRKVSEKIEAIYAARSRERGQQVDTRPGLLQRDFSNASTLASRVASGSRFEGLSNAERGELSENVLDTRTKLLTGDGDALLRPSNNKIQDRIKLFSNGGIPMARSEEPLSPVRSHYSGGALASRPQTLTSYGSTRKLQLPFAQSEFPFSQIPRTQISLTRNNTISMAIPESTRQLEQLQPELGLAGALSNTERNYSHINNQIKHFETFQKVQPTRAVKKPIGYGETWPRLKPICASTWPQATSEKPPKQETTKRVTRLPSSAKKERDLVVVRAKSTEPLLLTLSGKGKTAKESRDEDRHRRKINSRQERLTRRSRSQCRSTLSQQSPTKDKGKRRKDPSKAVPQVAMEIDVTLDNTIATAAPTNVDHYHNQDREQQHLQEIWIDGRSEEGSGAAGGDEGETGSGSVRVREQVVAQCVLSHPKPRRLAETLRMLSLCRHGFEERARGREQERERDRERLAERERERERERLRIRVGAGAGEAWRRVVGLEVELGRYGAMGGVQQTV